MKKKTVSKTGDNSKACAILSYILIGIIWYFIDEKLKNNKFVKYHVKQGLVLLIASIAYCIVLQIILSILFNPFTIGAFLWLFSILRLLGYVPLIWAIIGMINAANNNEKELPIIGKYADNFSF